MPVWLQENVEVKIGFYQRLMALQPHTREAIFYGVTYNWITIEDSGKIRCIVSNTFINRTLQLLDGDARDSVRQARFLGRWFSTIPSLETIMALWGIRP